jgi:hypothetical protein
MKQINEGQGNDGCTHCVQRVNTANLAKDLISNELHLAISRVKGLSDLLSASDLNHAENKLLISHLREAAYKLDETTAKLYDAL